MVTSSVVLYKTNKALIETLIKCIIESDVVSVLYVIDNAPCLENEVYFRRFKFIRYIPHSNTGYGSSHNIALDFARECGSTYHIVLNPDISFGSKVLNTLINYMDDNPETSYVMPKILNPDGSLQPLCKLLPDPFILFLRRLFPSLITNTSWNHKYCLMESGYDHIMNVPCLSGCFMFMRMSVVNEFNIRFDPRFFMYMEDFDLVRTIHRYGRTEFYPYVNVIHNHSKSSFKSLKMCKIHIQSAIKYFNKYGWFKDKERSEWNRITIKEINQIKHKEFEYEV